MAVFIEKKPIIKWVVELWDGANGLTHPAVAFPDVDNSGNVVGKIYKPDGNHLIVRPGNYVAVSLPAFHQVDEVRVLTGLQFENNWLVYEDAAPSAGVPESRQLAADGDVEEFATPKTKGKR